MTSKRDVLQTWNEYVSVYKHIRATIGDKLNEQHPLPFNELRKIFGHKECDFIDDSYAFWVDTRFRRLFKVADQNGLGIHWGEDNEYYQLELRELSYSMNLDDFIKRMGIWSVEGDLGDYLKGGVGGIGIDEVDISKLLDAHFNYDDYGRLCKLIKNAIDRLNYRLKVKSIELAVKECDEELNDAIGNCAKHLEATYHQLYNKAIKLIGELSENSKNVRKLEEAYALLCNGEFSRWYYSGIYGHGMPINEIVELIKVLEQQVQQD